MERRGNLVGILAAAQLAAEPVARRQPRIRRTGSVDPLGVQGGEITGIVGMGRRTAEQCHDGDAGKCATAQNPTHTGDATSKRHRPRGYRAKVREHRPVAAESTVLDQAEGRHRVGHLDEAGDVGAEHVVARRVVLVGGDQATVVNALHDRRQPLFGVLEAPRVP